jgi:hypothetical protein
MNVELRLTITDDHKVRDIHELLCLAIHELDPDALYELRSCVENVGEVRCVDPDKTPFDMLSEADQLDVVELLRNGNDHEDAIRVIAEGLTRAELDEAIGQMRSIRSDIEGA